MSQEKQLERDILKLIRTMDGTRLSGDDEYIQLYEQYQVLRKKLEAAPSTQEMKKLAAALDKSFEGLSGQLSFCTLA